MKLCSRDHIHLFKIRLMNLYLQFPVNSRITGEYSYYGEIMVHILKILNTRIVIGLVYLGRCQQYSLYALPDIWEVRPCLHPEHD